MHFITPEILPTSQNPDIANKKSASALVIGGGIGGMRAALDLADAGLKVFLIEQTPSLGGRVAQLGFMFPQHDCVLCRGTADHGYGCTRPSISPAYGTHNLHPNIEIMTNTRVIDKGGQAGDFTISLRQEPRYIDTARCISCGYCAQACPVELPDDYQQKMTTRKAISKISTRSTPDVYFIDKVPFCDECNKCVEVCPSNAINLQEQPRLFTIEVGAIILALGFQVFNPNELEHLGYNRYPNVIQAMEYERLASRSGPTEGTVIRPSDRTPPKSIAWLQCVGSRDKDIPYCSSICCMYATKEAMLAKQRLGNDVHCQVFIMDERAFNKEYSTYFSRARDKHNIQYTHCRISSIQEDPTTKNLILNYASPSGERQQAQFEMVVLATGLQPPQSAADLSQILGIKLNEHGFCETDKFTPVQTSQPGVFVCGAFSTPKEIAETIIDASGAAAEVMRLLGDRLNTYPISREWPFLKSENLPPETDISNQEPRIGVFACACGGTISDLLDLSSITQKVLALPGVAHSEIIEFGCFPEYYSKIQKVISDQNLNRVVIAGCSNRTHDSLFQRVVRKAGLNPYLVELVNLREQCVRVHRWDRKLANQKAFELIRIAVGRVSLASQVHKKKHRCRPNALVIGGGLSGMTTALTIGDAGYQVHLVEQTDMLGGNLQNLYYVAEGFNPQRLVRDLVNRTRAHQNIVIYTRTKVIEHHGHVGFFQTQLNTTRPDGTIIQTKLEHGVTIVATGAQESHNHPLLALKNIITQRDLEEKIVHQPEEIAKLRNVVMIQCVTPENVPRYCSRVCCTNAMKNAIRIRLFNPDCRVYILYKNIVTYGFRETFYTDARNHGVIFIRYTDENPPKVFENEQGQTLVEIYDPALDVKIQIPADLVPLSMTVLPSPGTKKLSDILKVPLSTEGFFQEAQIKLRPMDFMQEGIFLAGMAHYPKFIEESITHALATAGRALTLLSQGGAFYLGGVVAQVDQSKCVGCLTCTRVCPFGIPQVITSDNRKGVGGLGGAAFIDDARCQGCGTCTGECPANAIQLINYTDRQIMLSDIKGLGAWQPIDI